jgi:hypothetical protein
MKRDGGRVKSMCWPSRHTAIVALAATHKDTERTLPAATAAGGVDLIQTTARTCRIFETRHTRATVSAQNCRQRRTVPRYGPEQTPVPPSASHSSPRFHSALPEPAYPPLPHLKSPLAVSQIKKSAATPMIHGCTRMNARASKKSSSA